MGNTSLADRLLGAGARHHAAALLRRFMRAARDAARVQERLLRRQLALNADSDFGRAHGFAKIRTYDEFVQSVPIQTYEDIRPYVDRVMAGEVNALLGRRQRVLMFAMTSGSTDKPKYVPVTRQVVNTTRRGWNVFGVKALLDHPEAVMRSLLQTVSPADERRTETGVPCGSISGLLGASQKRLVRKYYAVPSCVAMVSDPEARYYTMMRFAVPKDVGFMVTASPATQLRLARSAESHAARLVRDVHDGTLSAPGEIPDAVTETLRRHLSPDPSTAARLDRSIRHFGALLPRHYWRLALLANWTAGSMRLHLQDFPRYFGDAPVRDIGLIATEGRVSVCLRDGDPAGVLDVEGCFFEFVDAASGRDDSGTVYRCHELTVGAEYRVLMTTASGFYRYDIGDHVRVARYEGLAPVIEFLNRGAYSSSITGEKLTERQVVLAFDRACRGLGTSITTFVIAPVWDEPPFYRLHVDQPARAVDSIADEMDRALGEVNIEYASKRKSGRLGPIVVNVLAAGTLARHDADRQHERGSANEQFKHRYIYANPGDDAVLTSRVPRKEAAATA
ncbi:MAG: GH3 auxin-responsive promoter family protein [Planctomycetes bacterium]|nr:GH3 auxin-responsive promoter family protein [Planctomycetota bacterium]